MSGPAFDEGICEFCRIVVKAPRRTICEKCEAQYNAGARWADAHWADDPQPRIELTPHGEILGGNDREKRHDRNYIDRSKEPT